MRTESLTTARAETARPTPDQMRVTDAFEEPAAEILTGEALQFVAELHRRFESRRLELLQARTERAERIRRGETPGFLIETADIRSGDWQVAKAPADLEDRRVEITGPAEPKMMINALNSGAKVFMADLEDALSPTWDNILEGQRALRSAVRRTLRFENAEGRVYSLNDRIATLVVRPRGWHLVERNLIIDDAPVSASLFDFGLYFFHNARELLARGSGPYFYLPKLENHLEARLWNDVFNFAQDSLNIKRGTIRATVLIETILAAFEMEEILFELRDHAAGLNAGRWDYLFSMIKKFADGTVVFPDRDRLTMTVPFMRSYSEHLVHACHRHGAHAIGGMAAFIPSRRDAEVNDLALKKVREDKEREVSDGFDGTWVAHPDLVPVAGEIFDRVLGDRSNQKTVKQTASPVAAMALLPSEVEGARVTHAGVNNNISVSLQYIDHWLRGQGAVAINNLMEDAATAEIARAELWQWVRHEIALENGQKLTPVLFASFVWSEVQALGGSAKGRLREAAELLERLVLTPEFPEFLTLPAYEILEPHKSPRHLLTKEYR